jgi:hypothetical protein
MRLLLVDSRVDTVAPVLTPSVDLSGVEITPSDPVDLSGVQTPSSVFSSAAKEGVEVIVYSYIEDTYASILAKATSGPYESVGIVSHAYTKTFQLLRKEAVATVENVQSVDPDLTGFDAFGAFLKSLGSPFIDMMACSLYSNDDWKYIFNGLETKYEIQIRASTDDTGNLSAGGNWIMESDNVNVADLYFTELIEGYRGLLNLPPVDALYLSDLFPYSSTFNGTVNAVVKDSSGDIYVGGSFTTFNGVTMNRIARWDGKKWWAVGSGFNGRCLALAIDSNGNIYAGGEFTTSGSETVNYIARYTGFDWLPLGLGLNGACRTIAIGADNSVYAGGLFTTAGGASANRIARWNGTAWIAMGSGFNGDCNSLVFGTNGMLHAGGGFTTSGATTGLGSIARWNGSSWSAMGSGLSTTCWALAAGPDGSIYAGGQFITAGGASANRIARWNGSSWSALGSGLGNDN